MMDSVTTALCYALAYRFLSVFATLQSETGDGEPSRSAMVSALSALGVSEGAMATLSLPEVEELRPILEKSVDIFIRALMESNNIGAIPLCPEQREYLLSILRAPRVPIVPVKGR